MPLGRDAGAAVTEFSPLVTGPDRQGAVQKQEDFVLSLVDMDRNRVSRAVSLRMISTWLLLTAESTRTSRVDPFIQASCWCSAAAA
jgi:hypothetical protein